MERETDELVGIRAAENCVSKGRKKKKETSGRKRGEKEGEISKIKCCKASVCHLLSKYAGVYVCVCVPVYVQRYTNIVMQLSAWLTIKLNLLNMTHNKIITKHFVKL